MKIARRWWIKVALMSLGTILNVTVIEAINPKGSDAFAIFGNRGLTGGYRWDAAPRSIDGLDRSLVGGLRYSLQGGSYENYRDLFTWNVTPSVFDFQTAIQEAFDAWTVRDPVNGLGTSLSFVADLNTPVVGTGAGGLDIRGAEIDLLASPRATFWKLGNTDPQAESYFRAILAPVMLTSGTIDYRGSGAIAGADITLNNNLGAVYTLDFFRRLLTHEIGHSLGLGDVEGDINPGQFIDDNYNGATDKTALATLTNPIAQLVDPIDPANSPFSLFTVPSATPGLRTPGVDILMESRGLGISPENPLPNLTPLSNDDYAGRQFLYPYVQPTKSVPEPSFILGLFSLSGFGVISKRRKIN